MAYFQLLQGTDVIASTESFTVIVLPDALADATVPESYDSAIQEAIDNANDAAEEAREVAAIVSVAVALGADGYIDGIAKQVLALPTVPPSDKGIGGTA